MKRNTTCNHYLARKEISIDLYSLRLLSTTRIEQADIKLVKSKKVEDAYKSFGEVNYSSSIGFCKVRNINQQPALDAVFAVISKQGGAKNLHSVAAVMLSHTSH